MAGTITHAFFTMDVYNKLDYRLKKELENYKNNLRTFGQGHDIFSFSNRNKSKYFHNKNSKDFFVNMIKYIKENNLNNNPEVKSFLFGYICHYVLDKNIHPFVRYKAGYFDKKNKESYKYRCKHQDMETYLDSYMVRQKEKIKPGRFKSHKYCLEPYRFSKDLKNTIDYTFNTVYNYKNASHYYYQGIKRMHFLYILLRNDYFGIKNKIYSIVDHITPKNAYKFSPISFSYKLGEKDYYLNLDNKMWNHPMYKTETYNTSAIDIYNNSVEEAVTIIKDVNKYLNGKNIDLNNIFDNSSFATGKNCDDLTTEQFYEY